MCGADIPAEDRGFVRLFPELGITQNLILDLKQKISSPSARRNLPSSFIGCIYFIE